MTTVITIYMLITKQVTSNTLQSAEKHIAMYYDNNEFKSTAKPADQPNTLIMNLIIQMMDAHDTLYNMVKQLKKEIKTLNSSRMNYKKVLVISIYFIIESVKP